MGEWIVDIVLHLWPRRLLGSQFSWAFLESTHANTQVLYFTFSYPFRELKVPWPGPCEERKNQARHVKAKFRIWGD